MEHVTAEDILCDDHSPNLVQWMAAGGKGIKILNEINGRNGSFTEGPRVRIRRRTDLLETTRRLFAQNS